MKAVKYFLWPAVLLILFCGMSQDVAAKKKNVPMPKACKTDKSVYAHDAQVTVTPYAVRGGERMFWIDGYDRLFKELTYEKPAIPEGHDLRKNPILGKPVTFKLDCPTSRWNHIVMLDKQGKIAARSSFWVTPDIEYWNNYEAWMYAGSEKYRGPRYNHMRGCNVNGSECYMTFNSAPFAMNDLRFYVEFCIPKRRFQLTAFTKNFWPKFMGAHRAGKFDPEKKYFYRPHCLNDPKHIEYSIEQMSKHAKIHRKFRHGAYSISDEPSMTAFCNPFDYCYCPHCMKLFREWLKEKYGSLDGLNKQWGTAFKEWDKVVPDSSNETKAKNNPEFKALLEKRIEKVQIRERNLFLDEMIKPGTENFSSWADHREFMDLTFNKYLTILTEKTRELDPHSPAGILGTQMPSAFGGWDFYLLATSIDWFEAYDMGNSWEFIRSFKSRNPRTVISRTTFTHSVSTQRYQVNSYFLKGGQGCILYWGPYIWGKKNEIKQPVLPSLRRTWGELRSGITNLRRMVEELDHPIGVYYNQPSRRASWLIDSELDGTTWPRRFSSWDSGRCSLIQADTGVLRALEDNGYQYKILDGRQVEEGVLLANKYKVLIMPRIICLSDKEAAAIEKFVKAGGVLVTDGALGSMDPQCRRRKEAALADLCGVTFENYRVCERDGGYFRWNKDVLKKTDPGKEKDMADKLLKGVDPSLLFVSSPGIRADGGQALAQAGKTSALIVNRAGKGMTICTNVYFADYYKKRGDKELSDPLRHLFRNILETAGLKPKFNVFKREGKKAVADGEQIPNLEQYFWKLGDARFAAFNIQGTIRQDALGNITVSGVRPGELYPLSVQLPEKTYVYDARTGEYFGKTDLVAVELDPYAYCWLSMMPYRVKDIDLDIEADKDDPLLLTCKAEVKGSGKIGDHVLNLTVIDPDNNICDFHTVNLTAKGGKAETVLRIGQNAKAGKWTFRVRDAATGVTGKTTFVKKDEPENVAVPVYLAVQDGRLFGQIRGPVSLKEENGKLVAKMWVRTWSEGLREPRGKITVSVNEPWKVEQSVFKIEEVNRKCDGDFAATITCAKDSDWLEKGITLTAVRETADGRKHTIKGKNVPGKNLNKKLNPVVPIRIRFNQYYEDMVRMKADKDKIVYRLPMQFSRRAGHEVPEGEIMASVSEGWKITPAKLNLREILLHARGEADFVVEGPTVFTQAPKVTFEVKSPDGQNPTASRVLGIHYAKYTAKAPTLDGKLDEDCWKEAYKTTMHHPVNDTSVFSVTYTDDTVYFGFEVNYGTPSEKLKAKPPQKPGTDEGMWNEEFFEILIDPTQRMGKIPYQFAMNYLGRTMDRIGELGRSWRGDWSMKGTKSDTGYVLEVAIPYKTIRTQKPTPYEVWGINPYRNSFPPNKRYSQGWSPVGDERASNFYGRLFFLPKK